MDDRKITYEIISSYKAHLLAEEKSPVTIEKYIRDIRNFVQYINGEKITKNTVIDYKSYLTEKGYKKNSLMV